MFSSTASVFQTNCNLARSPRCNRTMTSFPIHYSCEDRTSSWCKTGVCSQYCSPENIEEYLVRPTLGRFLYSKCAALHPAYVLAPLRTSFPRLSPVPSRIGLSGVLELHKDAQSLFGIKKVTMTAKMLVTFLSLFITCYKPGIYLTITQCHY